MRRLIEVLKIQEEGEGGYAPANPSTMVGVGAITTSNPTDTGNTQTTASSDKGSGDATMDFGTIVKGCDCEDVECNC